MSDLVRDVAAERALHLAVDRSPAAIALSDLALARAHPGVVHRPAGRSFLTEYGEEAADAVSYATWGEQSGEIPPDDAADLRRLQMEAYAIILRLQQRATTG